MPVINTNVKSTLASDALRVNERSLSAAMQQLSTGKRINSAKDDAAGLAISTRMTADLRGMSMAMKNANDAISMMQTAEGALGEVTNMLQRMRELAVQSATGSMTSANRKQLQAEFNQLVAEIDNTSRVTKLQRHQTSGWYCAGRRDSDGCQRRRSGQRFDQVRIQQGFGYPGLRDPGRTAVGSNW